MSEAEALADAKTHYGEPTALVRDEDVLDTWFSSGPVAVLDPRLAGRDARSLQRYYPTNVLVTGFDIIFFWVARMMMMGLHFMDEVPFHTVYHARAWSATRRARRCRSRRATSSTRWC